MYVSLLWGELSPLFLTFDTVLCIIRLQSTAIHCGVHLRKSIGCRPKGLLLLYFYVYVTLFSRTHARYGHEIPFLTMPI